MKIKSVKLVYFSPTGTTEKVLEGIARGASSAAAEQLDLTLLTVPEREPERIDHDLVILGAPVYDGRIAPTAVERLRKVQGNSNLACVIVLYGNREYEDALLELRDLSSELGFKPIAGGGFVGEHSFDTEETPIATGRPDEFDLAKAQELGERVRDSVAQAHSTDDLPLVQVPGNHPYKEYNMPSGLSPETDPGQCSLCEVCASVCPTAAITVDELVVTDKDECIACSACIKNCTTGARHWDNDLVLKGAQWLSENFSQRREPETYY